MSHVANMHKVSVSVVHAWMCVRAEQETQRKHDLYSFFTIDPRPRMRLRRVSGFSGPNSLGFGDFLFSPCVTSSQEAGKKTGTGNS